MVKILINDWPLSMGATGFFNMDTDKQITSSGNLLQVPIEWFETLPERFFEHLMRTYSMGARREQQLKHSLEQIKLSIEDGVVTKKDLFKFHAEMINKTSKEGLDRVAKYFPQFKDEVTELLLDGKAALKELDLPTLERVIGRTVELLNEEEIDQKLTLNVVKATVLQSSGGQVSFLNVIKSALTYKEQVALFRKDFVNPVIFELKLQDCIVKGDKEAAWKLIQESEEPLASQWKKKNKKATEVDFAYFAELPSCSGIDGQWGTMAYEEMMFMPLASTSLNDFYNGQMKSAPVISSLARLLLFVAPLGCVSYRKKIGCEEHFVFSFLHVEGDCAETKARNDLFRQALQRDNLFSQALVQSHEKLVHLEKERHNVTLLIEWMTDRLAKKTLLEYRVVHEKFIRTLLENDKHFDLNKVFPFAFREQLVHQALRNHDSKVLIFEEMRRLITENSKNYYSIKMALNLRELIFKEGEVMEKKNTLTNRMYNHGKDINKELFKPQKQQEGGDYKAPIEKKLASISYRLLNAAKGGNRQVFFETVLRLHVLANQRISKEFTSLLDRKEVSDHEFATMSLAFIAGLMCQSKEKEAEEVKA